MYALNIINMYSVSLVLC